MSAANAEIAHDYAVMGKREKAETWAKVTTPEAIRLVAERYGTSADPEVARLLTDEQKGLPDAPLH
jgi:hypothetical protein